MSRIKSSVLIFCIVAILLEKVNAYTPNVPIACPPHFAGYAPHPLDCNLFLQCSHGAPPSIMSCGPGKLYNRLIQRCDFPVNVPECLDTPQVAGNQWNQQKPGWGQQQQPANPGNQWNQPRPGWGQQQPMNPGPQWNQPAVNKPMGNQWNQPAVGKPPVLVNPGNQWNQPPPAARPPAANPGVQKNPGGAVKPPVNNPADDDAEDC